MKFRTELNIPKADFEIAHSDEIMLIGSCFSENLGNLLNSHKFPVTINPFGTLYDPISIFKILNFVISNNISQFNYLERGGVHLCYECHSDINADTLYNLENTLKEIIYNTHNKIVNTKYLFITFGTSYVYKNDTTNQFVANCHKQAASNFTKILLEPAEVLNSFKVFYNQIKTLNPDIKIITTLSPVRHIKDGISENQLSKSILRYCISEFCKENDVYYFPAYEFVLDDLRDYRFYNEDLIHPNSQAINYIWDKFSDHYFSSSTIMLNRKIEKLLQNISHKPFNPKTEAYKTHLTQTLLEFENLSTVLNVTQEIESIQMLLNKYFG